jgi:hypothetical protein
MNSKLRLDFIAIAISLAAAVFTGLQWWDGHKLGRLANDATVVVDVDSEPGRSKRGIIVRNAGPGIAHIKAVKYYVDGQLIGDINEPFERIAKLDSHRLLEVTMNGDAMSPGEKQQILRFDASKSEQDRAEDFFESHLNVAVAYCSADDLKCETVCGDPEHCAEVSGIKPKK